MVAGPDWEDMHPSAWPAAGYDNEPRGPRLLRRWLRRRRPAPQFPTVEQLASCAVTTCVCHRRIARWPYPGQGAGTAGEGYWWVHVDNARRSHTRDTHSPYFWTGVNRVPYARPVWQRNSED